VRTPDPTDPYPLGGGDRRCVFIRPTVTSELLEAGEYTYYDASEDEGTFEQDRMLYAYGPERLVIGRYCSIAAGTRFMLGGEHVSSGPSAYPFTIFPGAWREATMEAFLANNPSRGDTVVGNDVWIGRDVTVMPGVRIGDGAIIATGSLVNRDVAAYSVVGGVPAKEIRRRYSEADAERMTAAAWWDWPVEAVTEHAAALMSGTVDEIAELGRRYRP